jgi:anaerobic ribonucleoside-triphosphate reductase activating protein
MADEKSMVILHYIDTLVDGPFIFAKKDLTLKYRGSSNQRVIDVKKSLETGKVVIIDE